MDFDFFREGEQFSNFMNNDHYSDISNLDEVQNLSSNDIFQWNNLGNEIEINEEMSLIPPNQYCDINITSDPCRQDFQKIMNDWQQLVNLDSNCDDFVVEDPITAEMSSDILNISDLSTFDITAFLKDDSPNKLSSTCSRRPRAAVKKIDHKARRYITQFEEDDDEVDVETISECGETNSPALEAGDPGLEAGDLNSLLEQFEATELPDLPECVENNINNFKKAPIQFLENNLLEDGVLECKIKLEVENHENEKIKSEPVDSYLNIDSSPETVKKEEESDIKKSKRKETVDSSIVVTKCVNIKNECLEDKCTKVSSTKLSPIKNEPLEQNQQKDIEVIEVSVKSIPKTETDKDTSLVHSVDTKIEKSKPNSLTISAKKIKVEKTAAVAPQNTPQTTSTPPEIKHKQIVNSLPQELINRIRESGKRKPISVIPPIVPNKRPRLNAKISEAITHQKSNKTVVNHTKDIIQLDHDYCSQQLPTQEQCYQKKDSGFESAEEEEQRTVITKQPVIKNVDGRMMVSLLKVNTIHSEQVINKKRKLNLEEYKKRREGVLKSQPSSLTSSPLSSNCSSPLPEDENVRLKKHQEKLMRMAMEVLNTPAKSDKKPQVPAVVKKIPKVIQIPAGMEKKTLVSIGVNTELKPRKNLDPLAPVEQLEQIKPLLKQASDKINCNSLITSLIENIPKVINSCGPQNPADNKVQLVHGEDKTIVYLPKERPPRQTRDIETQTNISLIQQTKATRYRRRRVSSTSSSSSNSSREEERLSSRCNRSRKSSEGSNCSSRSSSSSSRSTSRVSSSSSYTSRLSSNSRSRSRSRSSSSQRDRYVNRKRREQERLREVEERRVIYVGRLSPTIIRDDLRRRFNKFGPITNISLHSREHGDNYGFVTFANKLDAYEAIEHGNDDPFYPKYDLSFGGRRIFCQTSYSDLDNVRDEGYYAPQRAAEASFDSLLREMQEKLCKRRA